MVRLVRDFERAIKPLGWSYSHTTGSHRVWKNPSVPKLISLPGPPNKEIKIGLLKAMSKIAGIDYRTI